MIDGYFFEGKVLKQRLLVRLWTGLDNDKLAEGLFERHVETLLSTLFEHELTRDCMNQPEQFQRLQPENPLDYETQFVAGQIVLEEA